MGLALAVNAGPIHAKSAKSAPLPPVEAGWERRTHAADLLGVYDRKLGDAWVEDFRPLEPDKALAACRAFAADKRSSFGCELFLYPSGRNLPQAAEAIAIYEREFAGVSNPAVRLTIALRRDLGVNWEVQQLATPQVLNHIAAFDSDDRLFTLGERIAFRRADKPGVIRWLYDHGARICDNAGLDSAKRFNCISFYAQADAALIGFSGPYQQTLDLLEQHSFRPHWPSEIEWAGSMLAGASCCGPSELRYLALFSAADRRKVEVIATRKRAEAQASVAAWQQQERTRQLGPSSVARHSPAENRLAIGQLASRGNAVCRVIFAHGTNFAFRAVVEGNSATRLQLRAASIRNAESQINDYPYADTMINPGTVFWDDAANWAPDC